MHTHTDERLDQLEAAVRRLAQNQRGGVPRVMIASTLAAAVGALAVSAVIILTALGAL